MNENTALVLLNLGVLALTGVVFWITHSIQKGAIHMLETLNQDRGTGKTTKVIELLNEDLEALLIIPVSHMKNIYPKEIHNRILTADQVSHGGLRGKRFSKVILDEGFLYNKEKLAHLYYLLGYDHIKTLAIGTV